MLWQSTNLNWVLKNGEICGEESRRERWVTECRLSELISFIWIFDTSLRFNRHRRVFNFTYSTHRTTIADNRYEKVAIQDFLSLIISKFEINSRKRLSRQRQLFYTQDYSNDFFKIWNWNLFYREKKKCNIKI